MVENCSEFCRYHLQAFRHLYVLAAEPRVLVPREVDTNKACHVPLEVTLKVRPLLNKPPSIYQNLAAMARVCVSKRRGRIDRLVLFPSFPASLDIRLF